MGLESRVAKLEDKVEGGLKLIVGAHWWKDKESKEEAIARAMRERAIGPEEQERALVVLIVNYGDDGWPPSQPTAFVA